MKTFIVAELSANHGHSLDIVLSTIRAAKESGADAIKIQTYTADTLTIDCDKEHFRITHGTLWDGTTYYKLYQDAYTPWEWHAAIRDEAHKQGLVFFSTPFDRSAADFLQTLDVPINKIASFEITDTPLIEYVASKGKPMFISTGIATLTEIDEAVKACRHAGNNDITLLKCTSEYPANPEDANLVTMPNMLELFNVKVGISDHTQGHAVAVAAVALGATVVEKHFILDRSIGGPDASFSMLPDDFSQMVNSIRIVEKSLGKVTYDLTEKAQKNRAFSRSLFVCENVCAGEILTNHSVRSIRPGYGLSPRYASQVMGRKATCDIERGTPLQLGHVAWDR